ncbi:MAG: serine/threonine protein kinase [Fimbriiglobus sp.]|nr:serine/threonine protein kinase [Fimbriiglobus sp.]
MPAPASTSDFLDLVRKSGLIPADRLAPLLRNLDASNTPIAQLATELVKAGLLTFFQSKQIQQGRYKRFQIAGKYRLLELLGVGGMGAVYLCEHELMKRLVAVKVLPVDKIAADPTALERFYREARAVAALNHPNVVQAYDIDKFDTVHFLVMEYVDGSSLQDVVARHTVRKRFFDPVRAAHYVAQAAAGLQHAGQLGLIHRDIKPGNLLLDRNGLVKVLDLGLARFFDHRHDGLTQRLDDKCVLGTADYLAPEQVTNDKPVDVRADVYGLGGTLYYMLTGSSPFPDGTVGQKLVAAQMQKPKPISSFRPDVPPPLVAVVETMMAKNPADRFQTMGEVMEALAPWTSQPIGPPEAAEMPELSPAVMERMTANPLPGRSNSGVMFLPAAVGSSSSVRVSPVDLTEASVPTGRPTNTARMRPSSTSDVRVLPTPSRPSARSARSAPAVPPAPRPKSLTTAILFAVGGVSFMIAVCVIYLIVLLLVK